MKKIDVESWPRKRHYEFFREFQQPFFDVVARVEVTGLLGVAKQEKLSVFATMMHTVLGALNQTAGFRHRFRGEEVFEVEVCHSSFTLMGDDGLFNYATAEFDEDLRVFVERVGSAREAVRGRRDLNLDDDERLPLVYCTSMPWLDFQSISHVFSGDRNDCFPRVAWGKFAEVRGEEGRWETTVQLTAHHALVDGFHAAEFFKNLERMLQAY